MTSRWIDRAGISKGGGIFELGDLDGGKTKEMGDWKKKCRAKNAGRTFNVRTKSGITSLVTQAATILYIST